MIKQRYTIIILWFVLIVLNISCSSRFFSVKEFVPLTNFEEMNGLYSNERVRVFDICSAFNLKKTDIDAVITFEIEFLKNNQLQITYYAPDAKYENIYKVKYKKNHVKIILQNQLYPFFPFYFAINKAWVRLGINEKQELTLQRYEDDTGMLLIFGTGGHFGYKLHFTKLDE